MEVLITLQKNVSKGSDRKSKKLVQLVLWTIEEQKRHLETFRCGSKDHLIEKCPKPPKDNEKRQNQVLFYERVNFACDNSKNTSDQNRYASMARMSGNENFPSGNFGDISQFTDWILDYEATCHITPEVSDFIPSSLEDTDKHIEVADRHHATAKQKCQVRIKICDDHGDLFITTLHNVLLVPNL